MAARRYELTDTQWDRIKDLIPRAKTGRPPKDDRMMLNACLLYTSQLHGGHESRRENGYSVAAMTALMVCIRFSASSKTMECAPSKTSSVTSMQSMPNLS